MYILADGDVQIALLHLVGKRQGTYKISPLIVAPEHRDKRGIGSRLLEFAEEYARAAEARHLYCTVAEQNIAAMNFFRKNGFIIAGKSFSHYKEDITEVMLYKPLLLPEQEAALERPHISVNAAGPEHYKSIRRLLLDVLPFSFADIDDSWVDALIHGYERRSTEDINQKYKLIFVATNREGEVVGVAGATPKKGMPIKVMPLIASTLPAFIALVSELPHLMAHSGRKLYIHMVPGPDECIVLQQHGWRLDAAMPAAYHPSLVTQQWSIDLDEKYAMRHMRVKQRYLDLIASGEKTLEVRVGYPSVKNIKVGERIRLMSRDRAETIQIEDVRMYGTFRAMLDAEDANRIVPGSTKEEVFSLLKEIYPADRESLGVVVLQVSVQSQPEYTSRR